MKLKLVVASMSILGLISSPAFAGHSKKHCKKPCQPCAVVAPCATDYKGAGCMPCQVETPCMATMIYDLMGQNNYGRATHAMPDWFNRISVSGGINADFHWGNLSYGYQGENNSRISVNDAYLNATALVNDWTKAFLSMSYNNASDIVVGSIKGGTYSYAYPPGFNMEQAYVTIGNFRCSPFFFQVGQQFSDYGRYEIHPVERTLVQVLTESLQTSAKLGFITQMGFHGQIYSFNNPVIETGSGHATPVFGAALGFDRVNDQLGYGIGVDYLSSLMGVNDIAGNLGNAGTGVTTTYNNTVGGYAFYGDVNSGPFSLGVRYTTAIQNFSATNYSTIFANSTTANGAKPWAVDGIAGYKFNYWGKDQGLYLGYQASGDAVNLLLPANRWLLGYDIAVWKSGCNANLGTTDFGVQVSRDEDYSTSKGGTGDYSNRIAARLAVKFG